MKIQTARLLLRDYRRKIWTPISACIPRRRCGNKVREKAISPKRGGLKLLGDLISHQISSDVGYRARA